MATRKDGPHIPPAYDVATAGAIQALGRGDASEGQQKLALQWIIEVGAVAYQFQYYPSDRDTAFALGRAFVGQQIVKLLKLNLMALRSEKDVQKEIRLSES